MKDRSSVQEEFERLKPAILVPHKDKAFAAHLVSRTCNRMLALHPLQLLFVKYLFIFEETDEDPFGLWMRMYGWW